MESPPVRVIVSRHASVDLTAELRSRLDWLGQERARLLSAAAADLTVETALRLGALQAEIRSYALLLSGLS